MQALHADGMGVHRAEIRLFWVSMALSMATAGLSSQPGKQHFRNTACRLNADRCQEREAVQRGSCCVLPWHRPRALPRKCWWSEEQGVCGEELIILNPALPILLLH